MPDLMNYRTNEYVREATDAEYQDSVEQAHHDGGAGAINVEVDGENMVCYVV